MQSIIPPATVLVTGANGFIGTWVCKIFLEKGYWVRGTVRSSSKGDYLLEIFKDYGERFAYYVVEDITKPGAFDEAIKSIQAVIPVASPATAAIDDPQDLIKPALNGTLELIHSINTYGLEVECLVLTSSGSAITDPTQPAGTIYTDDDWNTWSVKQMEEKGKNAGWDKYRASKVLAERAAWEEVKKQNRWDLVAIHRRVAHFLFALSSLIDITIGQRCPLYMR
ncbi:NAD-dependent epimerase/dehydratase family protein, partial [Rhizoctonia solani 123E]